MGYEIDVEYTERPGGVRKRRWISLDIHLKDFTDDPELIPVATISARPYEAPYFSPLASDRESFRVYWWQGRFLTDMGLLNRRPYLVEPMKSVPKQPHGRAEHIVRTAQAWSRQHALLEGRLLRFCKEPLLVLPTPQKNISHLWECNTMIPRQRIPVIDPTARTGLRLTELISPGPIFDWHRRMIEEIVRRLTIYRPDLLTAAGAPRSREDASDLALMLQQPEVLSDERITPDGFSSYPGINAVEPAEVEIVVWSKLEEPLVAAAPEAYQQFHAAALRGQHQRSRKSVLAAAEPVAQEEETFSL